MRGSRCKALRATFQELYGHQPPKARWVKEKERGGWFKRLWWKLTGYTPKEWWRIYPSVWRRWKKAALASDRS